MNILPNYIQYNRPAFYATKKQPDFPTKIQLTEVEQKFYEILMELHRVESDIKTQKQNLWNMYSAQDRGDYKELLKLRQSLLAKLRRIAKKESKDYWDFVRDINVKKEYNRFAPKLLKAKTEEELRKAIEIISTYNLFRKAEEMLEQIILSKKF